MDFLLDEPEAVVNYDTYISVLNKIAICQNNWGHTCLDSAKALCSIGGLI